MTTRFKIVLVGLALWTAACSSPPTPARTSLWGTIITVGQTEQTDAPAIWPEANRVRLAWIGADKTGVHQDIRSVSADGLSEKVVLPLLPVHPYAQQVAPAPDDGLHLLWLDANQQGETRLYDAEISTTLEVERGPTQVTEQRAQRFVIIPREDGGLWVISSGGLLAEPALYIRDVDAAGRPRIAEGSYRMVYDADWPATAQHGDGAIDLYWIAASDGQVYRAQFVEGKLTTPQAITTSVALNGGDRLESFNAAVDHTHAYLFWNVTRAAGQTETWLSTASLDAASWPAPSRLGIDTTLTTTFETGFNSGSAQAAQAGSTAFAWAKPAEGQFDTLPVAGVLDKTHLALLYFKDGVLVGYQDIASISSLLGLPNLAADRDRHLYLAWAEPSLNGYADLNLTMTRPF